MLLLIAFAFLAGIVTVLSPCILPILPVVLSGGVSGGRARPWGVITGFTLSFTLFTLTLSTLVQTLGIDPDVLRWISAGLILIFGLVLVVPQFKDLFMIWATRLVSRSNTPVKTGKTSAGYWAGLVLGLGLGMVWTPCVGPIMASVITLALSSSVDYGSLLITVAYTLGTAIPLLLIMLGGRSLLQKFPWFTRHSSGIQRGFGILMVATAVALFTGADRSFSTWILQVFPNYGSGLTAIENQDGVKAELKKRSVAAPLAAGVPDPLTLGQGAWINSPALTLAGLKGKVVLLDFWTYSCVNCLRTLPYLRAWYDKYHNQGLEIVGVHSPEFAFEHSEANLRQAIAELKVTWPVVQDNAFGIWKAYQNQYWPAHYLYDRAGTLIETHFGEGNYAETEAAIVRALGLVHQQSGLVSPSASGHTSVKTPETYLGFGRGRRFVSPEKISTDLVANYSVPSVLASDHWALGGSWKISQESAEAKAGSYLMLHFQGDQVYLVIKPGASPNQQVRVTLNGQPVQSGEVKNGRLTLNGSRLYTLVDQAGLGQGILRLDFEGEAQVFAFTFG